jgi:hypothetical protein
LQHRHRDDGAGGVAGHQEQLRLRKDRWQKKVAQHLRNAQVSYTNWTDLSRQEFIKGETAYSGQDKEVAEKIKENANASGCSIT